MKGVLLLAVGLLAGFAAAHLVSRTAQGRTFLDRLGQQVTSFGGAVAEGYRAQQAEYRAADG